MNASRWRRPQHEPEGHSHRLPGWLFVGLAIIVLGLVGGIVLVSFQAIATNNRLTALEQYVAGKGEQRDAENAAQNRRIDAAVCSVLDQLPAGGRLDVVRTQYRCGPGQPPTLPPSGSAAATPSTGAVGHVPRAAAAPASPTRQSAPRAPGSTPAVPAATSSAPPAPAGATSTPAAPASRPIPAILCALDRQLCSSP